MSLLFYYMRVAIDCRWIFPKISGIGKYTENLINGLKKNNSNSNCIFLQAPLVTYSPFSLKNQIFLPRLLNKLGVDLYHSSNFMISLFIPKKIKVVITIHDLIPFLFPHYTPAAKKTRFNRFFRWILKKAVNRADKIIAVSRCTGKDIVKFLGVDKNKVHVVYNCVDGEYQKPNHYNHNSYILFVGRRDPYKNLVGLIRAYARLVRDFKITNKLLIVGEPDPRYPEPEIIADELNLREEIDFRGYVEKSELVKIYRNASVLVLPSLYEGFGLPVVEAMACGVPVIVSNTPALVEITGGNGIYIDPDDTDGLVRAMRDILHDKSTAEKMSENGKMHAKKFSMDNMTRETGKVYESCFGA